MSILRHASGRPPFARVYKLLSIVFGLALAWLFSRAAAPGSSSDDPADPEQKAALADLDLITIMISTSLELADVLDGIKAGLAMRLGIPGGSIFLYESERARLSLADSWGLPEAVANRLERWDPSQPPYQQALADQQHILTLDLSALEPYCSLGLPVLRPDWHTCLTVPLIARGEPVGILDLFERSPYAFNHHRMALLAAIGRQVGMRIRNAETLAQIRAGRDRSQTVSQQILEAQEAERRHISRELHDQVGQALTALKVNLQFMEHAVASEEFRARLKESMSLVDRTLEQVRNLSLDLRPSLLDDLGIVSAIRWYVDRQAQLAGFEAHFDADPPDMRLEATLETACFRIVQEAVTNVVRHARARNVWVELNQRDPYLELVIRDDGIGFDVPAAKERGTSEANLGLLGMSERVHLLGGEIEITSDADSGFGTLIRAVFPLSPEVAPLLRRPKRRERP